MTLLSIIKDVFPNTPKEDINRFSDIENQLAKADIYTRNRLAGFISQIGHESQGFSKLEENLNYSAKRILEVFPRYFTPENAKEYEYNPRKFASRAYGNRMGNGPESSGDGYKYRGRGLIHLTGKNNYVAFGNYMGYDMESNPDYVSTPKGAIDSAIWYWNINSCNLVADVRNTVLLTKKINGGDNGLHERIRLEALAYSKLQDFTYTPANNVIIPVHKRVMPSIIVNEIPVLPEQLPQTKPLSLLDIFKRIFGRK